MVKGEEDSKMQSQIKPFDEVVIPNKEERERYEKIGYQKISENKVAAVLMAGGFFYDYEICKL